MGARAREYDMSRRDAAAGRTRDRLLRAARDHFAERRYDDVTLADIAGAAGVTVQTLLNHFGSKEGLLGAAVEFFAREIGELRGSVEPGDIDGAVDALMRHYEVLGDGNWRFVADAERLEASLGVLLEQGRAMHRLWLEEVFGPYLPASVASRDDALAALYAATDVGTWKLLRRDLGCTPEQTRVVIRRLVAGQLHGG